MSDSKLAVRDVEQVDSGRCIARLTREALSNYGLTGGSKIRIIGTDTATTKAWPIPTFDDKDCDSKEISLDQFTRQKAGVEVGNHVTIERIEPVEATEVTVAPARDEPIKFGSDPEDTIRRQLYHRPFIEGEVMPVMASTDTSVNWSPDRAAWLVVSATNPEGIVQATDETVIVIEDELSTNSL